MLGTLTAHGAIDWSVSLVSLPFVAVPAYAVFGHSKFEGSVEAYEQSNIDHFRDLGIKFYAYAPGFLHEKVMLVYDEGASVGTANLDNRSFRLNFEVTALLVDKVFATETKAMFEQDFAHPVPIDPESLDQKPFWWHTGVNLSRLAAPVL